MFSEHVHYLFLTHVGSYCIVVSAFDSQNDGELSIEENDTVVVISVSENGWWTVRKSDDPSSKEGIVPSVCLKDLQDQNTNSQSAASPTVNDGTIENNHTCMKSLELYYYRQ